MLCVSGAAVGSWALQTDIASDASQSVTATALISPNAGPAHVNRRSASVGDLDSGSPSDDKAVKGAGLRRDRPATWSVCEPRGAWSPPTVAWVAGTQRQGDVRSRAPATVLTGQDLLTQLCVARR
ncbi:hypothetical protein A9W99_01430 [Mycobacterium sp. 1164966.3]|nr:hypothetical protein A9W99_01430 [Mycobacterium sp. 1164966.3]